MGEICKTIQKNDKADLKYYLPRNRGASISKSTNV